MENQLNKFADHYAAALEKYMARQQEASLQYAYELGRRALAEGLGVLALAQIHQATLLRLLLPAPLLDAQQPRLKAAETFCLETLSPFEATHRGFRETNRKLSELNETLANRNLELAAINRDLKKEISERKQTEAALRESEEHYRLLLAEARQMHEDLQHLSKQMIHVQEEERKRISRELHDEVGQALTAINMTLTVLGRAAHHDQKEFQQKLADARSLLEQTMETVHHFSRELRPAILDDLGITPALRSYLKAFSERTGVSVQFRPCPETDKLGSEQKTVLYRIAQESLTNVAKHAQATQVELSLRPYKGGVSLEIKDNGKGFRADQHLAGNGKRRLGLLGMQERVRLVSGHFTVESQAGKGTTIRVQIPFNPKLSNHYEKDHCAAGG